jgi:hydrogenase maturation protein HypF
VGFRPFVYRTARRLGLNGYVSNNPAGVFIEVEGARGRVDRFLRELQTDTPPLAKITHRETALAAPVGYREFEIRPSSDRGAPAAVLLPDMSICADCTRELLDAQDRRYRYPFINCTNCGPRFTLIEGLPYDRPNTTMKAFTMCPECQAEYDTPRDRRYHAQPNACPRCGPAVWLVDAQGTPRARGEAAVRGLLDAIEQGGIVAVKGVGGFHLICDATREAAVERLRARKGRSEKPFAVMFRDLEQLRVFATPNPEEEALLLSQERPVVLIRRKGEALRAVSPGLLTVGAFLPYSPLHHLILEGLDVPVVATSGNLSEEPIVKENDEALARLGQLCDALLLHDRPIHRRCDDSVVKEAGGAPQFIRRARGYVSMPVLLPTRLKRPVLAVGGQLKNTFAIGFDTQIVLSQHIGDMESPESLAHFEETLADLCALYQFEPELIVHDLHPRYETTRWAQAQTGADRVGLQHHYAHILSCMAEHGLREPVTGIAWDGTGYGKDGTLWGGEVLACDLTQCERTFHLRPLRLIGGERAVREPRRVALSILFDLFGEESLEMDLPPVAAFDSGERAVLWAAWRRQFHAPFCSSAGRLFDAVAALTGQIQRCTYEAQAAMMIEDCYDPDVTDPYAYAIDDRQGDGQIDWRPLFRDLLADRDPAAAPTRFLNTLVGIAHDAAVRVGRETVCLSGGVFQNGPLCAMMVRRLRQAGFRVYYQTAVPPNDGGISLGQAYYGGMLERIDVVTHEGG